jgi:hypothetical protein
VRDHVEIDLVALGDMPPKIVERHQEPGREHIGLVFDLAVFAVPTNDILLTAPDAVGIRQSVNEVMPEFVPEGEVDAPFRRNCVVVENPPAAIVLDRHCLGFDQTVGFLQALGERNGNFGAQVNCK